MWFTINTWQICLLTGSNLNEKQSDDKVTINRKQFKFEAFRAAIWQIVFFEI